MTNPERVELQAVESSLFSHAGYDARRSILGLRFKNGDVYQYGSVPADVATEFLEALSLGHFYGSYIKGKYPAQKMTGACPKCGDTGYLGEVCLDCGCADYTAPIRHALNVDHPAAASKRLQPADCGKYFRPSEFAQHVDGVTCPDCLRVRQAHEATVL